MYNDRDIERLNRRIRREAKRKNVKVQVLYGLILVVSIGVAVFGINKVFAAVKEHKNTQKMANQSTLLVTDSSKIAQQIKSQKEAQEKVQKESKQGDYTEVDERYFDDAVFVGDSRTQGFELYAGLNNATFYAVRGLTVTGAYDKAAIKLNGKNLTVMQALKITSFGKVYIMFGLNEIGWPNTQLFVDTYTNMIKDIKAINPKAEIYVQSIIHVTEKKAEDDEIENNKNIDDRNALLKEIAKEQKVHYLDINEALDDENGNLSEEATSDGIHLNVEYCKKWKQYLMKYGIVK